jgi:hypothetical protein
MTILSRLQTLGIAKESTPGTYLAPVRWLPITAPKPEDVIETLRDESIRGNDAVLQGLYGGASHSTFDYTLPHLYPDVLGDHLRAILGPDTVTAGASTTLSALTTVGASSITTAVSIPAGSTIMIDTAAKTEYATTGTPTGAGPYTIPIVSTGTGTTLAQGHAAAAPVVVASTHTFKQDQRAAAVPTYSLAQNSKIETRGYPGCVLSDFGIKIDPKSAVSADAKWMGFPSATQSNTSAAFSSTQPVLGWQWALTLGGVASTRAISGEYSLKRAVEAINSSDGTQGPREIFPGALEADYKMKAIFENNTDFLQFTGYTSVPVVSTLTQALAFGGSVVTITSTGQKFIKFVPDYSGTYLAADIDASGVFNSTDNGVLAVSLTTFSSTAY